MNPKASKRLARTYPQLSLTRCPFNHSTISIFAPMPP